MAILSRDDFMNKLKEFIGESNDDNAISTLEDFTDTYDDLIKKSEKGAGDWEQKYNDMSTKYTDLQKKYKDRFFSGKPTGEPDNGYVPEPEPDEPKPEEKITFDDLFNTKE